MFHLLFVEVWVNDNKMVGTKKSHIVFTKL